VNGARSLCASSQLTGVDQKSCTVRLLAALQCSLSADAMASSADFCRIATVASVGSGLLEIKSVAEFLKKLLSISDVPGLNRDGPRRL
jgi:hypothetical protein